MQTAVARTMIAGLRTFACGGDAKTQAEVREECLPSKPRQGSECVDWLHRAAELTRAARLDFDSLGAMRSADLTAKGHLPSPGEDSRGEGTREGDAVALLLRRADEVSQQLTDAILLSTEATTGADDMWRRLSEAEDAAATLAEALLETNDNARRGKVWTASASTRPRRRPRPHTRPARFGGTSPQHESGRRETILIGDHANIRPQSWH